jgi:hypothetical protein
MTPTCHKTAGADSEPQVQYVMPAWRPRQLLELAALFRTTVSGLIAMAEETPQPGVQTAAMLWPKSNVQLDQTARDGIQGFTNLLGFYASLASKMKRDIVGMTRSPFLPGACYGEYAVDAKRKASEVRQHLGLGRGPVATSQASAENGPGLLPGSAATRRPGGSTRCAATCSASCAASACSATADAGSRDTPAPRKRRGGPLGTRSSSASAKTASSTD